MNILITYSYFNLYCIILRLLIELEVVKLIMDKSYLTLENLDNELRSLPVDTSNYRSIIEFAFEDCIVDLMDVLDSQFDSELGPPAYPRLMVLLILLFGEEKGIEQYTKLNETCYTDDVFKVLIDERVPSRNILSGFINLDEDLIFTSVFLYTLVKINDYHFFPEKNSNYLDGSDARINGSVNYLISEDEIEALEQMKEFKLIHDGSEEQIRKVRLQMKLKLKYYKNHKKYAKLLGLALKRTRLYNWAVYNKIDEFKEALTSVNKNYVSINFPEAIKLKCKKNDWDMGFNLQEVMTSNSIILTGLLSQLPNDAAVLKEVEQKLKRNLIILQELEKNYGERWNYDELEDLFLNSNTFCDSGYDGEENMEFIQTSTINFIILTKKLSRQINNKLRKRKPTSKKKKKNKTLKNEDDHSITECERVENGYICPFGRLIKLVKVIVSNCKYNQNEDLPDPLLKLNYKHECEDCSGCPYFMKHKEPCSIAKYTETTTEYRYELTNCFVRGDFDEDYPKRFHVSEGINGYLKRKNGILFLYGHTLQAATNHLLLKNTLYNIKRFVKLKGSVC